jgi:serine/threonine-protein kinase
LHLGSISPVSSETYFQNTIVDQTTSPGEKVAKGSTIGIIVSTGKASKALSAPDLTGKTVSEAQRIVERDGLRIGRITYQKGLNLIPNTIVDQFPRAGEAVVAGAVIDLFVARLAAGEDELPGRED